MLKRHERRPPPIRGATSMPLQWPARGAWTRCIFRSLKRHKCRALGALARTSFPSVLLQPGSIEPLPNGGIYLIGEGKGEIAVHAQDIGGHRSPLASWQGDIRGHEHSIGRA